MIHTRCINNECRSALYRCINKDKTVKMLVKRHRLQVQEHFNCRERNTGTVVPLIKINKCYQKEKPMVINFQWTQSRI